VQASAGRHTEVAPDIAGGTEVQLGDGAATGLEAFFGVLGSDSGSDDVASRLRLVAGLVEVDFLVAVDVLGVKYADVLDPVQVDAHGDLELAGGQVDVGDHLCAGVFDLEAWVELEEGVGAVLRVVEVLYCACADVADHFGKSDGVLLCGRIEISVRIDCRFKKTNLMVLSQEYDYLKIVNS